jgi:NADPH-dependent 2,4-dienoyl-CoA reductase/sulfur reductase-like enzyme
MTHFIVVGASLAGLRSVEAARKAGHDGPITLIGAEAHLPYDRPPLSKKFLDATVSGTAPESTEFRDEAYFAAELDVTLRLGAPATSLDTTTREVLLDDERIRYDLLVIATGTHARTLPLGAGLAGIHPLRTLDDARAIRAALDAGARTVVIGAGFIGSEIAASAGKRGLDVTILEALPTPLVRAVGPQLGAAIAGLHERNGTRLLCNAAVSSIDGTDSVESVTLADGTVLPADLVVVGVGAQPTTDWLAGSGLTIDNGVVCDETLWTGVAGVYAAGDAARWHNPLFDRLQRLEHWTSAAEQGAAAARNALDPSSAKPYSTVPYFWSDWYDSRIQFVGIPEADEIVVVDGDVDVDRRWIALYRGGDRIVGALTVNGQAEIMKYRGLIARSTSWADALEVAEQRRAVAATKALAAT